MSWWCAAGSTSSGLTNEQGHYSLILAPQNFRVPWDHWQMEKPRPDLGLTYIVHLDWCQSPNPQVCMAWGCLRTL